MPFLSPEARAIADRKLETKENLNEGELTYAVTKLLITNWKTGKGNYAALCQIIGALECAKQQFYVEVVAPYENKKKEENGDIYNED